MKSTDLRPGLGVQLDGKLYVITAFEHRTPGNLRSFVQVKIKDIVAGKTVEKRLNSGDDIEVVNFDRREMEYLYPEGDAAVFMDGETFDQVTVQADVLGDALKYLEPNARCVVMFHDGNPVTLDLPSSVEVTVTETPPGIKGATATNQLKEATCDTGLKTRVPPFIEVGERIKIATADGSYMSRA